MSRWKDSNTPGKKVSKKVLRYFLIIPRLQRLYKSSHTAKEMIWHATGKCTEPGKMQHPVDGRAWKNFDTNNLSQAYIMWPVILTTYNLPPWLCMKESSFMLTLLNHVPKSPGKDIDVYLRPLIEDLKARQDLQRLANRSGLWLGQTKNGKCLKPQAAYSFTTEKAKLEGSIAEGYVTEEALTFSSHYFRDVTTKFNRPDRNVDPPPPTCQFQVFRSVCKSIGLRSVIWFDAQELKKVKWYVLHNSPEIDTYRSQFKSRDERRITQNSGICSPGPDGEMYYGQLQELFEFKYLLFKVVLFRVKWNIARAAQNRQNQAKSTVISRMGSRSLARLRDEMFESGGASGSGRCGDEEEGADHQDDEDEDGDGDT
uniref:DUF4218 domain-containing protein n=1 Tax=Tanacetum cinerariifolium TaxID=118510 RepID=A0A6L2LXS6_TANCI|nr:hypothetical protein [Tanacetum cinerariifolium]